MEDRLAVGITYPYDAPDDYKLYAAESARRQLGEALTRELPWDEWVAVRLREETREALGDPPTDNWWAEEKMAWAEMKSIETRHVIFWEPPPDPYSVRMYMDVKLGDAVGIVRKLVWKRVRGMRVKIDTRLALFIAMQGLLVVASL